MARSATRRRGPAPAARARALNGHRVPVNVNHDDCVRAAAAEMIRCSCVPDHVACSSHESSLVATRIRCGGWWHGEHPFLLWVLPHAPSSFGFSGSLICGQVFYHNRLSTPPAHCHPEHCEQQSVPAVSLFCLFSGHPRGSSWHCPFRGFV